MSTPDPFIHMLPGLTAPAIGAYAVTPSNTTDLPKAIRAVTINVSGAISYDWEGVTYTTGVLPVGRHDFRATRIRATGTTAADITGWV